MKKASIRYFAPVAAAMFISGGAAQAQGLWGYSGADNDLYTISAAGPTATLVGNDVTSGILAEIEYGGGFIWGSDTGNNSNLHKIDPATGLVLSTTTMSFPATGNVITAMEFIGSTLYAGLTTEGGGETYLATIDLVTGDVSSIGATGSGTPYGGLAYNGTTLYGITAGGSSADLVTLDLGTGEATSIGLVTLGGVSLGATALEFGTDGVLYALPNGRSAFSGSLLSIDTTTTVATNLGSLGVSNMNALTAVPEPATMAVLALGALGMLRRKRRN